MQQTLLSVLFLFLLCSCGNPDTKVETPVAKPEAKTAWHDVKAKDASFPTARHEAAFIGLGDKYYLLGGRGIKPVDIFDSKTQNWSEGAKSPLEIHHFQPVVWNDEILLLGAMTGGYPGETPLPDMNDAVKTHELCLAADISAQEGRPVKLSELR